MVLTNSISDISGIDFKEGQTLLVDKPFDWTSFDVVNKLRYSISHRFGYKKIKVGHAGTLDPRATGLLILCTGKFTKKIESFQGLPKAYVSKIKFGGTTPSYDAESEPDHLFPTDHITKDNLTMAMKSFIGESQQIPPLYSAVKIKGQPAYKLARRGKDIVLKPRPISIYKFDLLEYNLPEIETYVECSKGTYIRSLAHDLGKSLESGAYLSGLRRTKIGEYDVKDAFPLDSLVDMLK